MRRFGMAILVGVSLAVVLAASASAAPPMVEKYLHDGRFAEGERALLAELKANPRDDQARFGLGTLQFLAAVERLAQGLHRYGLRSDRGQLLNIPFLRLPLPVNQNPETVTYPALRLLFKQLLADLEEAESTLAAIRDKDVKLPLRLGPIQLDLDGDGKPDERLAAFLARYLGGPQRLPRDRELLVVFDRGDVAWLRGYCHLLSALAEVFLAHDAQKLFDCTAHIFFARPDTPHKFLLTKTKDQYWWWSGEVDLIDAVALIHLLRLPVNEPRRMKSALGHLEQMIVLSRECWKFVLTETDDDHEWLPNPKQTSVLGVPVTKEMIASWHDFLDEAEALLAGKRLIPFWLGKEDVGINLRRVFTEPHTFDLVLWVQGTAATPYLEKGPMTRPAVWQRLQRVFGGEFIGFAIWFN